MSTRKSKQEQSVIQDVDMESESEQNGENEYVAARPELEIKRVEGDNTSATYSFLNEDHTLGNLLRNVIIKSNQVEFCAYSVPHPSEPVMNLRLQVSESAGDTKKVLRHGLKRISKMSDVLLEKFNNALSKHKASSMSD